MARKVFGEVTKTGTVEVWVNGPVSPETLDCLESFIAHKRKQHSGMFIEGYFSDRMLAGDVPSKPDSND